MYKELLIRPAYTSKISKVNTTTTVTSAQVSNFFIFQGFTGKELDEETNYYYFGARYLDPRTSRWISADPAMGDYVPQAPVNDEARKRNGNLPGQGGVFNTVNFHVFGYAGNNPVKMVDPDGNDFYNFSNKDIVVKPEDGDSVLVHPGEMYKGKIDGAVLSDMTVIKVTDHKKSPVDVSVSVETIDGKDKAFKVGSLSSLLNKLGDIIKSKFKKDELPSGVYSSESAKNTSLSSWQERAKEQFSSQNPNREGVSEMSDIDRYFYDYNTNNTNNINAGKQQIEDRD